MEEMAYMFTVALSLNHSSDLAVLTQELCLQDQFSCFSNFIVSVFILSAFNCASTS